MRYVLQTKTKPADSRFFSIFIFIFTADFICSWKMRACCDYSMQNRLHRLCNRYCCSTASVCVPTFSEILPKIFSLYSKLTRCFGRISKCSASFQTTNNLLGKWYAVVYLVSVNWLSSRIILTTDLYSRRMTPRHAPADGFSWYFMLWTIFTAL